MLECIKNTVAKIEDKKWVVAVLAAGIALAAAVISVLVFFAKKDEEAETEEDCIIVD